MPAEIRIGPGSRAPSRAARSSCPRDGAPTGGRARPAPARARSCASRTDFVGRDNELDMLEVTYERVCALRAPHLVTLIGDAGIGKTSSCAVSCASAPPPSGAGCWAGAARRPDEHVSAARRDPPGLPRPRCRGPARGPWPNAWATATDCDPCSGLPRDATGAWEAKTRLTRAWIASWRAGRRGAGSLVVEDVHWAEEPLLDLAETAREALGPLLVLGTARPELTGPGGPRALATRTCSAWLEPLSPAESERQAQELVAGLPSGRRT